MNLATLQGLSSYILEALAYWPVISLSTALAWLFVRLAMRWLPQPWLRWPAAILIAAIAWIPYGNAPVGMYAAPFGGSISVFSVVLMLAAVQTGREVLLPASVWLLIVLTSIALALDQFGWLPWPLHAWGYLAEASRLGQIVMLLFLLALVVLIAFKRRVLAMLALLPAMLWRFEAAPSPNFWEAYIDLPLALAALLGLFGFLLGHRPDRAPEQAR